MPVDIDVFRSARADPKHAMTFRHRQFGQIAGRLRMVNGAAGSAKGLTPREWVDVVNHPLAMTAFLRSSFLAYGGAHDQIGSCLLEARLEKLRAIS